MGIVVASCRLRVRGSSLDCAGPITESEPVFGVEIKCHLTSEPTPP